MKIFILICFTALLGACSAANFVSDAPKIHQTSKTPDHFELPARFAVARTVYGAQKTAGVSETELWRNLAERAEDIGSFRALVNLSQHSAGRGDVGLIDVAREQRFNYLIVVRMDPSKGAADVILYHVGSGGVMATAQAVSPKGGKRGFWGWRIRNPARLERATLAIAEAAVPAVEDLLRGAVLRQR
ncbi:MAG: hypothetical protein ABJL67_13990 [Sulfitobacter sp.]